MRKTAFIFSASSYFDSTAFPKPKLDLPGVNYDVEVIKKRLEQIGFNTITKKNATKDEYFSTIEEHTVNCPCDAINIVYFSGHGGHSRGDNYIYSSDFPVLFEENQRIEKAAINISNIILKFRGKGRLILILDACRTDFDFSKGYFSEMTYSENVYIAYATMFQRPALGITDNLSVFTQAICDEILTPNIDIDKLFTKVRNNIFRKHSIQIPASVNALLEPIVLHKESNYTDNDKQVYNFIKKYGDEYVNKHGYFAGDDLIFIDAAQYFDISLLDAIWKFNKVSNKISGIQSNLTEAEQKLISFLGFERHPKFFTYDENHTWYYNGRQIRMGEIPPLPPSMQPQLPEIGKEIDVYFTPSKLKNKLIIKTNLPDGCELFIEYNKNNQGKYSVNKGNITIPFNTEINEISIDSCIFTSNRNVELMLGDKRRNLIGVNVKYCPIFGNKLLFKYKF